MFRVPGNACDLYVPFRLQTELLGNLCDRACLLAGVVCAIVHKSLVFLNSQFLLVWSEDGDDDPWGWRARALQLFCQSGENHLSVGVHHSQTASSWDKIMLLVPALFMSTLCTAPCECHVVFVLCCPAGVTMRVRNDVTW